MLPSILAVVFGLDAFPLNVVIVQLVATWPYGMRSKGKAPQT